MNNEYIGTVALFPYNAIPYSFLPCDGRTVPVVRFSQLFSLLNNRFGGDGRNTFGLPNLNYRIPVGADGPNGINLPFGTTAGQESFPLIENFLPPHTHPVTGSIFIGCAGEDNQDSQSPVASYLRRTPGVQTYAAEPKDVMGTPPFNILLKPTGKSLPINNMQPTIAMVYAICCLGKMPSRS